MTRCQSSEIPCREQDRLDASYHRALRAKYDLESDLAHQLASANPHEAWLHVRPASRDVTRQSTCLTRQSLAKEKLAELGEVGNAKTVTRTPAASRYLLQLRKVHTSNLFSQRENEITKYVRTARGSLFVPAAVRKPI